MATAKAIKSSLFGFLSIALMSAPAFAQNTATIDQTSDQQITQHGYANTATQGNLNSANVNQGTPGYYPPVYYPFGHEPNTATITQDNHQKIDQKGDYNTATQGNMNTANVNQGFPGYPSYPFPSMVIPK
jgi:hypothetical protein